MKLTRATKGLKFPTAIFAVTEKCKFFLDLYRNSWNNIFIKKTNYTIRAKKYFA